VIAEMERDWIVRVGTRRLAELRATLTELNEAL